MATIGQVHTLTVWSTQRHISTTTVKNAITARRHRARVAVTHNAATVRQVHTLSIWPAERDVFSALVKWAMAKAIFEARASAVACKETTHVGVDAACHVRARVRIARIVHRLTVHPGAIGQTDTSILARCRYGGCTLATVTRTRLAFIDVSLAIVALEAIGASASVALRRRVDTSATVHARR